MEQFKLSDIKIKNPYLIIFCTILVIFIIALFFIPTSDWKRIFSGRLNNFATVFNPAVNYLVGTTPESVFSYDLNNDGEMDLVVTNGNDNTVSILLGDGTGGFTATTSPRVGSFPVSIFAADFNGDHKIDLAVANQNTTAVSILLGDGTGGFATTSINVGSFAISIFAADFNNDGNMDLATANDGGNTSSILLGDGTGGFATTSINVGSFAISIFAADFNGDHKIDLTVANAGSNDVSILLGNGDGTFSATTSLTVGSGPVSVFAADFNNDGKEDLAVANANDNSVSIFLGDGTGGFSAATNFGVGSTPESVFSSDFNNDGNIDLATANYSSNDVSILLGNGDGTFSATTSLTVGSGPVSVFAADFNNDGKEDLAIANANDNSVSILLNVISDFSPTITTINPISVITGAPSFTLTVNGNNFISSSTVRFNGSNLTTTFASSTKLTALIPYTDLTTSGTFSITVKNSTFVGGTSNPKIFNVNTNLVSGSIGSNSRRIRIFVTPPEVPGATIITLTIATTTPTTTEQASTTLATTSPITTPSILPANFCFTRDLSPFTSAPDVKYLQIFLNNQNFNATAKGSENDYYATRTVDAVSSFQEYYSKDILKPSGLSSGTGNFGTATRLKANDILGCLPPSAPIPVVPTTTPIIPKVEPIQIPPTEPITANNLFSNIIESIRQSYGQALLVLSDSIKTASEIINSPSGSVITKTISTASLVLGSSAALGAIAFANPITFSEIWFIPGRILGLLIGALGIRKKARPWGTVYDSITKRPLDPVYVTLINMRTNKEVASAITDLDGRYGFLVLPGKYKISVQKTNYMFPSQKMSGVLFDEVYNDLYFGNEITVTTQEETITKNIPMDSESFDWNEFTKNKSNINSFIRGKDITWAKISKTVFAMGALISIIALIFAPRPYNLIIAILYAVAYIFNYFVFKVKKPGIIMEKATGLPLSFGIVKIFREGMSDNAPIVKKITDRYGRYYSLVPKGNYHLEIEKKNDDESYSQVFKSKVINVKKGIINEDFEVESAHTAHTHQIVHRKK